MGPRPLTSEVPLASPARNDNAAPPPLPQTSAPDPTGRRKFDRKDIQLDVSLYSDSNFYAGFTENLSAGGVFVATHNLLPAGHPIDVTITLPNDQKVVAKGIVRWIREYNEASDCPPGMGIQFLSLEGESLIAEFLSARAPLFHDDEL